MKRWLLLLLMVACQPRPVVDVVSDAPVKEFTVRAFQFGYDPATIEVNKGDRVVIHAYSDDVPHGLRIPDFGVQMSIYDSTPVTAEFIADKSGEFSFSCSIPCGHGHKGMSGMLVVI